MIPTLSSPNPRASRFSGPSSASRGEGNGASGGSWGKVKKKYFFGGESQPPPRACSGHSVDQATSCPLLHSTTTGSSHSPAIIQSISQTGNHHLPFPVPSPPKTQLQNHVRVTPPFPTYNNPPHVTVPVAPIKSFFPMTSWSLTCGKPSPPQTHSHHNYLHHVLPRGHLQEESLPPNRKRCLFLHLRRNVSKKTNPSRAP